MVLHDAFDMLISWIVGSDRRKTLVETIRTLQQPAITQLFEHFTTLGSRVGLKVDQPAMLDCILDTAECLSSVHENHGHHDHRSTHGTFDSTWGQLVYKLSIGYQDDDKTLTCYLCFKGTGSGTLWKQLLTDLNILPSLLKLSLDGLEYPICIYGGMYASLFESNERIANEILAMIERRLRAHPTSRRKSTKWHLRLGGYSLGGAQMLWFLMWYMSDATQRKFPHISAKKFESITLCTFGDIAQTRCDYASSYLEAMRRRNHNLMLFQIVHPVDLANRLFINLPISGHINSTTHVLDENGIHLVPTTVIGTGIVLKSLFLISLWDVRSYVYLRHLVLYGIKNHMSNQYLANVRRIHSRTVRRPKNCAISHPRLKE